MGFVTQTSVSRSGDHDEFTHCDVVLSFVSSQRIWISAPSSVLVNASNSLMRDDGVGHPAE